MSLRPAHATHQDHPSGLSRELHIISGNVQGVGFRPFVYTTALQCALTGFVQNTHEGVRIEVQGREADLTVFHHNLRANLPPLAIITSHQHQSLSPLMDENDFIIRESTGHKGHNVFIGPDVAMCDQCLADILNPTDRRFHYPFTNCTNCGPRYSIIRAIPYDRTTTSMACFPMCDECEKEYTNPANRRFHAQPNACPTCGPHVWFLTAEDVAQGHTTSPARPSPDAIPRAARLVAEGKILALKGLGGFHLVCLAHHKQAIAALRQRKHRPHKPFALMTGSLQDAQEIVTISPEAANLLASPAHPIVLCPKKSTLPETIAPDTDFLGIMLPYTPLHHIFMLELKRIMEEQGMGGPPVVVMTSGNLGGEPICLSNREALAKLGPLADGFLLHNRDIIIRVDDSVVAPQNDGTTIIFRRARGYAPLPLPLPLALPQLLPQPQPTARPLPLNLPQSSIDSPEVISSNQPPSYQPSSHHGLTHRAPSPQSLPSVLGLGAELKNTICLNKGHTAFISQHLGDMQHVEATCFHDEIVAHFQKTLAVTPNIVVHDKHPDYYTTHKAHELGFPRLALQHHAAHAFALLGENAILHPSLVLTLDGTGYGDDGTLWGGEALLVDMPSGTYTRLGAFSPLFLPGGEAAIAEPWRIAHALCLTNNIDPAPFPWLPQHDNTAQHLPVMLEKQLNTPLSSSCGRLFDAVSALLGQGVTVSYEGQAAIRLENLARQSCNHKNKKQGVLLPCPFFMENGFSVLDTNKLFVEVCAEINARASAADIALAFHESLVAGLAIWAKTLCASHNLRHVGLTGGCCNNGLLLSGLTRALADLGLQPVIHTKLPCGDGNIAYGQVVWGSIVSR